MSNSENRTDLVTVSQEIVQIYNLLKKPENLRLLLDSINCGIMIVDPQTQNIVIANRISKDITGLKENETIRSECDSVSCSLTPNQYQAADLSKNSFNNELIFYNNGKVPILKKVNSVVMGGKEYLIESFIDISSREKADVDFNYICNHDLLTGLYNRFYFKKLLSRMSPLDANSLGYLWLTWMVSKRSMTSGEKRWVTNYYVLLLKC